jgi:glycosyltransferase involved in cell wall biosynthesis
MIKKVAIVAYYWPPSSGSGVQRWLKFVKYLPTFGWTPFIVTPEAPSVEIVDPSLRKDIPKEAVEIRLPIWEPTGLFLKISGWMGKKVMPADMVSTGKKTGFRKLAAWIRGNYFIPDGRKFWVKPTVNYLDKFLRKDGIEVLITTGPPHSMHLIGLELKRRNPALHWVADFRDPWSEWDLLDTFSLSARARKKHQLLERQVLETADRVITIAPYHVNRFEALGRRKVDLITNGFDEDDFKGITKNKTSRFTILHVGVVDELRDPRPVVDALSQLCSEVPEFENRVELKFVGHVNSAFKDFVENNELTKKITSFVEHMPHDDLIRLYGECDLQLLVLAHTALAPGNLPGKIFEYLASGNPILAIGPEQGDAADILQQTKSGAIIERSDSLRVKNSLLGYYENWNTGTVFTKREIHRFTRKNLTAQLAQLLESLETGRSV